MLPETAFRPVRWGALIGALVAPCCAPAIDFHPHDDRYMACGRRAEARIAQGAGLTVVGTVHQIDDATPVDGPVKLLLIDAEGKPRRLYFGSLFTRPGPTEQRKSVYRAIAPTQRGDCVRASGSPGSNGSVNIDEFENLDRAPRGR